MNIQERIEALETEFNEKIKTLKAEAQRENEFPQDGDEYWYITDGGDVDSFGWEFVEFDLSAQAIGNVYKTKEQAEFAVEKLKVEAELRKFSRPFEVGKSNTEFYYWHESRRIMFNHFKMCQMQGSIYFESEEKAQQAIESVGEERIKKYIFGVED